MAFGEILTRLFLDDIDLSLFFTVLHILIRRLTLFVFIILSKVICLNFHGGKSCFWILLQFLKLFYDCFYFHILLLILWSDEFMTFGWCCKSRKAFFLELLLACEYCLNSMLTFFIQFSPYSLEGLLSTVTLCGSTARGIPCSRKLCKQVSGSVAWLISAIEVVYS